MLRAQLTMRERLDLDERDRMPRKKASKARGRKAAKPATKPHAKTAPTKAAAKPTKTRSVAKASSKAHGGSAPGSFPCPDCDFVAKHAMGLGRHRSTRHGAVSVRAQRAKDSGAAPKRRGRPPKNASAVPPTPVGVVAPPSGWVTRRQAAALGGVHYNTVRLWERAKLFKTQQRDRDVLIEEAGFRKVLAEKKAAPKGRPIGATTKRTATAASVPAAAPGAQSYEAKELLARLDALADGLESLARLVRPRKRRGRPPKR